MSNFDVRIDLSGILATSPQLRAEMFQNLSAAVERVAMAGAERWREEVLKARLWDGERQAYASTIRHEMTGPYSAVIVSDYKYVEDIENGRPPRDLKRMLDTSTKVRRTKDGRRFLVIPMRDNTPGNSALAGAMPAGVYGLGRQLAPSKITGEGERRSGEIVRLMPGRGMMPLGEKRQRRDPFLSNPETKSAYLVAKREYEWGGKLTSRALRQAGISDADAKRYAGMHRFDATTPGGKRYSTYIRFRMMIEGQSGWIVPARPGLHIAEGVANGLRSDAQRLFEGALLQDIANNGLAI